MPSVRSEKSVCNPRRVALPLALILLGCAAPPATSASVQAAPDGAVAHALDGRPLLPIVYPAAERSQREALLEQARARSQAAPRDVDALIWYGRRLGYLGRFQESIDVFTRAAELAPDDPRPLRQRGHRWISLRDFERAVRDLERAAQLAAGRPDEIEPAGLPNARGAELDTLQQSIFYHLGLAYYLRGEHERALAAWRECQKHSDNPDAQCSVAHWIHCALGALGRSEEARREVAFARPDLDVIENHGYHRLLLAYSGQLDPSALLAEVRAKGTQSNDFATVGYGLGLELLRAGRTEKSTRLLDEVAHVPNWSAFGCIAAEAELARQRR